MKTWDIFTEDAKTRDGSLCESLGICEVKFGFVNGQSMLEMVPVGIHLAPDKDLSIMIELKDPDWIKENILGLANNVLEINETENSTKKELEGLLQNRKDKANAINELEV